MAKVEIDEDLCIACGICYGSHPDIFADDGEGNAILVDKFQTDGQQTGEVPTELGDSAREAAELCPTEAITIN